MQKLTRTCSSGNLALLTLFIIFSMLYIISTTFDYIYQLCFLYMLNCHQLTLQERESSSKHERNYAYLSKIENSSDHQELISHPIPEHIGVLDFLVRKKFQQPFPDSN